MDEGDGEVHDVIGRFDGTGEALSGRMGIWKRNTI